jgi:hypothetical protein
MTAVQDVYRQRPHASLCVSDLASCCAGTKAKSSSQVMDTNFIDDPAEDRTPLQVAINMLIARKHCFNIIIRLPFSAMNPRRVMSAERRRAHLHDELACRETEAHWQS